MATEVSTQRAQRSKGAKGMLDRLVGNRIKSGQTRQSEVVMSQTWQLQDAKNKFSQVVKDAVSIGPQIITRHGAEVAVVLSYQEYRQMVAARGKLSDFFRSSPLADVELDLSRDASPTRLDTPL